MIFKITRRTTTYGLNSIHHRGANDWNELLKIIGLESDEYFSSKLKFTKVLKAYLLKSTFKVAATDMRYFARSKLPRSLVHQKNFTLI